MDSSWAPHFKNIFKSWINSGEESLAHLFCLYISGFNCFGFMIHEEAWGPFGGFYLYFSILRIFSPCIEPSLDICRERNVSSCFIFLRNISQMHFSSCCLLGDIQGKATDWLERKTNFLAMGSGIQYVYRVEMRGIGGTPHSQIPSGISSLPS